MIHKGIILKIILIFLFLITLSCSERSIEPISNFEKVTVLINHSSPLVPTESGYKWEYFDSIYSENKLSSIEYGIAELVGDTILFNKKWYKIKSVGMLAPGWLALGFRVDTDTLFTLQPHFGSYVSGKTFIRPKNDTTFYGMLWGGDQTAYVKSIRVQAIYETQQYRYAEYYLYLINFGPGYFGKVIIVPGVGIVFFELTQAKLRIVSRLLSIKKDINVPNKFLLMNILNRETEYERSSN